MAEPYKHIYRVDLNQPIVRRDVGMLATFDSKANRFGAELFRDGAAVNNLSGCTVTGYFIRPNEETVQNPGVVSGNQVYVDLLPACYLYDGAFEFTLKIKQGDVEQAVLMCYGTVERSRTDATASGGEVIVTVNNAEKLGGKPPEYYIQPRNLLDNSYFRKPVNQRAANGTFTAWGGYTIDRWAAYANGATIGVTDDGLSLQNAIYQAITAEDMSRFNGKWLTFGVKINGVVYVARGLFEQTDMWHMLSRVDTPYGYISIEAQNDNKLFCVIDSSTTTTAVEWAALYEGSYTVDSLPPYVPKGYAAELMECQRYCYAVPKANAALSWHGYFQTTTEARFTIPIGTQMRVKPTLTFGDIGMIRIYGSGVTTMVSEIKGTEVSGNYVTVTLGGFTNGVISEAVAKINTSFALSADL